MKAMTVMTMMTTTLLPSIAISACAELYHPDTHSNYNFVNAHPQDEAKGISFFFSQLCLKLALSHSFDVCCGMWVRWAYYLVPFLSVFDYGLCCELVVSDNQSDRCSKRSWCT